jgi:hypothetical protein
MNCKGVDYLYKKGTIWWGGTSNWGVCKYFSAYSEAFIRCIGGVSTSSRTARLSYGVQEAGGRSVEYLINILYMSIYMKHYEPSIGINVSI